MPLSSPSAERGWRAWLLATATVQGNQLKRACVWRPRSLVTRRDKRPGRDQHTRRPACLSPQATVNKLYRIDQQKIAEGLPAHLDEAPEVAPQLQQQTDLLETASKTFSRSKTHGKLRHHAKHRIRHHARHRMRHHARQRSRTSVKTKQQKKRPRRWSMRISSATVAPRK